VRILLSPAQRELWGRSYSALASALFISVATVKTHLLRILAKLG
jgi:DNA-binding CsgD family transcriptional regulator